MWIHHSGTFSHMSDATSAIRAHVETFFAGHSVELRSFDRGPIYRRVPNFEIACIGPGPRMPLWTFVTLGCWDAVHAEEHGLEFLLVGPTDNEAYLESLAMAAHYHAGPASQRLDVGHTVPIGEPLVEGSTLDHELVSPPYPFGPELESCAWQSGHARLLWLLPITKAERDFKVTQGLEVLESLFEEVGVEYWDPFRSSVV